MNKNASVILKEFTDKEIYFWAVWADEILEKLFGKIHDKTKLLKIYLAAKRKFRTFKDSKRWLDALEYFYAWRLNHLNEHIEIVTLKETILRNTIRKELLSLKRK